LQTLRPALGNILTSIQASFDISPIFSGILRGPFYYIGGGTVTGDTVSGGAGECLGHVAHAACGGRGYDGKSLTLRVTSRGTRFSSITGYTGAGTSRKGAASMAAVMACM
jgi:hypothetical protein